MKSMTGFGQGELSDHDRGIFFQVEISSVNRKQLEVKISLPPEFSRFEIALRNSISEKISRGTVQLRVKTELKKNTQGIACINEIQVISYFRKIEKLKDKLELNEKIPLAEILNLPGSVDLIEPEYNLSGMESMLKKVVNKALGQLIKMREDEGKAIKEDCEKRLQVLISLLKKIKNNSKKIPEIQKKRLLKRLQEMKLQYAEDDDRILREIVIFTDRADVSEEIARLESHFEQFTKISDNVSEPIGRSLDFLIQEMFREITTLGNKAAHSNVTPLIVQFKTELEKIREQVQNVE